MLSAFAGVAADAGLAGDVFVSFDGEAVRFGVLILSSLALIRVDLLTSVIA
jgi:hypothetical protein